MTRRFVFALVLLLVVPLPAGAQASPVEITAWGGIGGYIDPTDAFDVTVQVSSDILLVGDLDAVMGSVRVQVPIEVPAGSTKVYTVAMPRPTNTYVVRLLVMPEGAEKEIASTRLTLDAPDGDLLVGVLEGAAVVRTLGTVRSGILAEPVVPVPVGEADIVKGLAPLAYLVAGSGAIADMAADGRATLMEWVESGGRVVASSADVNILTTKAASGGIGDAFVTRVGLGELLVVGSTEGMSIEQWSAILRDVPQPFGSSDPQMEPGNSLMQAAVAGGAGLAPALPWLFAAIVAYALIVGPVNFVVLRRLGRRELAWITIPVIALAGIAALWFAGRSQIGQVIARAATVVVAGQGEPHAEVAIALVSGTPGELTLTVPEGWRATPSSFGGFEEFGRGFDGGFGGPAAAASGRQVGQDLIFDLPKLGAATATATVAYQGAIPSVTVSEDGKQVDIVHQGETEFWAWGLSNGSTTTLGPGVLAAGEQASLQMPAGNQGFNEGGFRFVDEVMNQSGMFDEFSWQRTWPLAEAVWGIDQGETLSGLFFFAFAGELDHELVVDGSPLKASGPGLVVIPLGAVGSSAAAQLLPLPDGTHVERGPGWFYMDGGNASFRYLLPETGWSNPEIQQLNRVGNATLELYDWESRGFLEVTRDVANLKVDPQFISPVGEVVLRLSTQGEFGEGFELGGGALVMEWDT